MRSHKKFTVTNPTILLWLYLFIAVFFVGVIVINTITTRQVSIAMFVCITIFIFIPCIWVMLWTKVSKITVDGEKITVRRWTGLKYSFTVDEITEIQCKSIDTKMGLNETFTIKTKRGKKVSISVLMNGFEKMASYIEKNVDQSKIHKTYKSFNTK